MSQTLKDSCAGMLGAVGKAVPRKSDLGCPSEVQFINFRPSCKDCLLESLFHQLTPVNSLYCEFNCSLLYARDHSRHFRIYLIIKLQSVKHKEGDFLWGKKGLVGI